MATYSSKSDELSVILRSTVEKKQAPITLARNKGKKYLDANEDFCFRLSNFMALSEIKKERLESDDRQCNVAVVLSIRLAFTLL
jgi:hypothetical protein